MPFHFAYDFLQNPAPSFFKEFTKNLCMNS
jgi:hypothetical protein